MEMLSVIADKHLETSHMGASMSNIPAARGIVASAKNVNRFGAAFEHSEQPQPNPPQPSPPRAAVPFPVKGFIQVDRTAVAAMVAFDLTRAAMLVYLILCQYANGRKAHAWPGTATLTRETGLSRESVKRARRELEAVGLVERAP